MKIGLLILEIFNFYTKILPIIFYKKSYYFERYIIFSFLNVFYYLQNYTSLGISLTFFISSKLKSGVKLQLHVKVWFLHSQKPKKQ